MMIYQTTLCYLLQIKGDVFVPYSNIFQETLLSLYYSTVFKNEPYPPVQKWSTLLVSNHFVCHMASYHIMYWCTQWLPFSTCYANTPSSSQAFGMQLTTTAKHKWYLWSNLTFDVVFKHPQRRDQHQNVSLSGLLNQNLDCHESRSEWILIQSVH